jgi:hypothetical protein
MHVFYALVDDPSGSDAAGEGLSLLVRGSGSMELYVDGALLKAEAVALPANLFMTISLTVAADGMGVELNGVSVLEATLPATWLPAQAWRFGAAASTGTADGDHHWLRSFKASGAHLPSVAPVSIQVSTNAQQFTSEEHSFTFYGGSALGGGVAAAPHLATLSLSAVSPSSGPVHGATSVTLSGANLAGGSNYTCRFGRPDSWSPMSYVDQYARLLTPALHR